MARDFTNAASARYVSFQEFDPADPDYLVWNIEVFYNGPGGSNGGRGMMVRFFRNATNAEKQTIERAVINAELAEVEPGTAALTNANIQISGRPV